MSFQNRDPINTDRFFYRDHDRDCDLKIADRFEKNFQGSILILKSLIDFRTKIGIRFCVPSVIVFAKQFFDR